MKVTTRRTGEVGIIQLEGKLDSFIDVSTFHGAIKDLLNTGSRNVLVDLSGVTYISSPGLGALMSGVASVHQSGGQLKLLSPGERVRTLLTVTRLIDLFEIYDDEPGGLASFGGG